MFYGTYEHNVDKKGRITIPASFREEIPDVVFVSKGFDGNLLGMPEDGVQAVVENLRTLSITDPDGRDFARDFFGTTAKLTYDSAGRILIPPTLRKIVGIEEEVVIIGSGSNFEIWAKDKLEQFRANSNPEAKAKAWQGIKVPLIRGI